MIRLGLQAIIVVLACLLLDSSISMKHHYPQYSAHIIAQRYRLLRSTRGTTTTLRYADTLTTNLKMHMSSISESSSGIMHQKDDSFAQKAAFAIPSGLCAVYKPKGWTSNDVVSKVKYEMASAARNRTGVRIKLKIGHGGTLDPMAEGVLVLGIGTGTKLLKDYLSGVKGYRAKAVFGASTDTLDSTGVVTGTIDSSNISRAHILNVLDQFRGNIKQTPPMYSALKRDGKKLYELARAGIEVEREAREVTVHRLDLLDEDALPEFGLMIECGGGFYVRSVIADIATSMGSMAHMTELVRTKQGQFELKDCIYEQNWKLDSLCSHILACNEKATIPAEQLS